MRRALAISVVLLGGGLAGCRSKPLSRPSVVGSAPSAPRLAAAAMPNPRLTPGAALAVDAGAVCRRGYARRARRVPEERKRAAYREYRRSKQPGVCCEVDHLIPLELGGSNALANLWPQPYRPAPGAYEKDQVEDWLHQQVCARRMSLAAAQRAIAGDWYQVYLKLPAQ